MKRLFAFLLGLFMVLSLAACGGNDPNMGTYNAVSCEALGFALDCQGDWLELRNNGKGKVCLMGEEYNCSWTLEGENFTLKNHGDEFSGTLHNGIITLDYGDMIYVYIMDPIEDKDGTVRGHIHVWQDATCVSGKICSECGAEEGEPAGHDSTEANYQQPPTCRICGEVTGETLQADMEKYGFTEFMELGVAYAYDTCCNYAPDVRTLAEVTVTRYEIVDEAEGYPAKEGYEWRIVEMQAMFSDKNAKKHGSSTDTNYEDYYTIELHDDTAVFDEETEISTYSVSYNGEIMEVSEIMTSSWSGWHYIAVGKKVDIRTVTWAFCVPKGYDGVVVGFRDASVEWLDDSYLYDYDPADFLLFRLN